MGAHTEHNWRERREAVEVRRARRTPDVSRRMEYVTLYSERCARCTCERTRIGGGRGLEPWQYPNGSAVMPSCPGRVVL